MPQPHKQFLVTLSVVYPLTLIVPYLFAPLFGIAPVLELPVIARIVREYHNHPNYEEFLIRRWAKRRARCPVVPDRHRRVKLVP